MAQRFAQVTGTSLASILVCQAHSSFQHSFSNRNDNALLPLQNEIKQCKELTKQEPDRNKQDIQNNLIDNVEKGLEHFDYAIQIGREANDLTQLSQNEGINKGLQKIKEIAFKSVISAVEVVENNYSVLQQQYDPGVLPDLRSVTVSAIENNNNNNKVIQYGEIDSEEKDEKTR